ncbi:hypothetical protein HNP82_003538 [Catenibacillus scindens]|uniref:Polysaccharide pyruvyl transferase domain-containing protein n=1 Tax=Catenibacillus scindens TaxID=673271 RepID=A0A7W8M7G4_9FIRM|nr:polysaccharide pyruvyl transferase family protein [Catenibacillus scindens]MBB5266381.1 hypothetical protein [Catenibacillus scindens]
MKKIGILTFHASHNCGSMLQAYALQKILCNKYKINNEIINYSSASQQRMYSILYKPNSIKELFRNFLNLLFYKIINDNELGYKKFLTKFELSKSISTSDELQEQSKNYDCIITGSDQVWNINAMDFDDSYMLPFDKVKKVAYAVSLGASNPNCSKKREKYKKYIEAFSAISVREGNAREWISQLIDRQIDLCVDPTLLLRKNEWLKITNPPLISEPYIFWYAMTYKSDQAELLKFLSKKYNMPVYVMNAKEWSRRLLFLRGIRLAPSGGPEDFLSLVNHASMVITSSFHGSVFSYIFKKNFWYISLNKTKGNDDRATFLLDQLGLAERYISAEEARNADLSINPVFDLIHIKPFVDHSFDFIEKNIIGLHEE